MGISGKFNIHVHRLKVKVIDEEPRGHFASENHIVKFTVAGEEKQTEYGSKGNDASIEANVQFDLKDVAESEQLTVEIIGKSNKGNDISVTTNQMDLQQFLKESQGSEFTITLNEDGNQASTTELVLSTNFQPVKKEKESAKKEKEPAKKEKQSPKMAAPAAPMNMAMQPTPMRPWFTRFEYFYNTGKNVYNYTTSFRGVNAVARWGESSANYVLSRVTGKELKDVDQGILVPVVTTVDDRVDRTISAIVTRLVQGQQFVLKKKDDTVDGVKRATNYTTSTISSTSSNVYGRAVSAKDYTTSQVMNVSSSAYGKVKGTTLAVASRVPYLGDRIRT